MPGYGVRAGRSGPKSAGVTARGVECASFTSMEVCRRGRVDRSTRSTTGGWCSRCARGGCRVEALVAVCGPSEWARQRCSVAPGLEPEAQPDSDGRTDPMRWLQGASQGVVHTRDGEAIARTLYRDGRLELGVPVGGGVRQSVAFATDGQGSRRRLRRFMAGPGAQTTEPRDHQEGGA